RSSGLSFPSSFIRPVTRPFLPGARTRKSSSAARSGACSAALSKSALSLSRSSMSFLPAEGQAASQDQGPRHCLAHWKANSHSCAAGRRHPSEGGRCLWSSGAGLRRLLQRGLRLLDQTGEGRGFMHRQIRQHLPIDLDPRLVDAVHELGVGKTMLARRRIDALNPERPELALTHPAIAVGILQSFFHALYGNAVNVLASTAITLGLLDDLLVSSMPGRAALDTCHLFSPPLISAVRQEMLAHDPGITLAEDHGATSLSLHLLRLATHHVAHVGGIGAD